MKNLKKFNENIDNLVKFSDEDIKTITGYIIYGLGMTADNMINPEWWDKYIGGDNEIPTNIEIEIGKILNDCLEEKQKDGEVL